MTFVPQNLVHVYYNGFGTKQLMGRLLLKNRVIFFEYDSAFIKTELELSPFKLPLKAGVLSPEDRTFEGLFGIFNDSIPDGWGRLLMDRKLINLGIKPNNLSPLDRLCFVGSQGMGALSYEPENENTTTVTATDLDEIDYEIKLTLEEDNTYIDDLLTLNGSSAGARPKAMLQVNNEDWLIKFKSIFDPNDIGAIEYAYHLMATHAGLNVPEAKLFPSKNSLGFFGVKRFDRSNNKRIHMHTIAGLLHADHRQSSIDYETIMKATFYLTRDVGECEVQFRNAVFNVLAHNRDDHSKNFSFLMAENSVWKVSPAYDLTFSSGPAGEHSTTVMGEGKNPSKNHLLKLADIGNIKKDKALEIIEQVVSTIQKWKDFAECAAVSKLQTKHISEELERTTKIFLQ